MQTALVTLYQKRGGVRTEYVLKKSDDQLYRCLQLKASDKDVWDQLIYFPHQMIPLDRVAFHEEIRVNARS